MGTWGGDTLKEDRLHRIGKALQTIQSMRFHEPLEGNDFSPASIALKLRCSQVNVYGLLFDGHLKSDKKEKKHGFQAPLYHITRAHLIDFVEQHTHSLISLPPHFVLDSHLLYLEEISEILGFCQNTIRQRFLEHGFLSYLNINKSSEEEMRRFIGETLELDLLRFIAYSLGISEPLYTTKLLVKRWSRPREFVWFWAEQKNLRGIPLGNLSLSGLNFCVYPESEVLRFERAGYVGDSRKEKTTLTEVIFK